VAMTEQRAEAVLVSMRVQWLSLTEHESESLVSDIGSQS